ncbi:MAG TPA: hypothetical protein P5514_01865 [Bacteroidales bacterium]|nr:hypothetical protein [Bacteroidales bacterium]HRX95665.1 hypothetical protein [Bacteroidales bacterium]
MKKLNFIILLILTLTVGCSKNNFETGIKGTVEYGQGDCMPVIDYESREYDNYKGHLYFIVKEDLDSLGNGDFEQLKSSSVVVFIRKGKLSTELPKGTYIVMPDDVYLYSEENTITINPDEVLNKDFKFWKCTSY